MPLTLAQAIDRKNNNFDMIRLVAALMVIFGHSFFIFPTDGYKEPLLGLLKKDYTGSLAVYIFFFLSGIFITASFVNSKTFTRYILMRMFRIYPALIVCNIITVFLVGAISTTLDLRSYLGSKETWAYFFRNNLMMDFVPLLPGVFKDNLFKEAVDGSLWTLPCEVRCYLLVILLGALGFLKNKMVIPLAICFVALLVFRNTAYISGFFTGLTMQAIFFFGGILAYRLRNRFVISKRVALILIAVCAGSYFIAFKVFICIFYVALLYTVLIFATLNVVKKIKLPGDYSYGIYIYGFLVQQTLAHLFPKLTSYPSMLISIPVTVAFGIISWYCIEKPALGLAKILSDKYRQHLYIYEKDSALKNTVGN